MENAVAKKCQFVCSKTQAKIIGRHRLAGKIFAIDQESNQC